jgi:hypothetical protein
VNPYRGVENNFYCGKIKEAAALRDTSVTANLIYGYTPHGIKRARTLLGLFQGTGEAML